MKFSELLMLAIRKSEIPLRFEPGAEEAVAKPVTEFLRAWLLAHESDKPATEFDYGRSALVRQLLDELDDVTEVPE